MHASLTLQANLITQVLSASALAVSLLLLDPARPLICWAFFAAGAFAGICQRKAVSRSMSAFRSATSIREIRALLKASTPGRWSIAMIWLIGTALIGLLLSSPATMNFDGALAAYAAPGLARESACLPAILALRKHP